jgi:hypothetical protein
MSKKTKEPLKEAKPRGNIQFTKPLLLREAYQIMKREDLLKKNLTYHTSTFQIEIV